MATAPPLLPHRRKRRLRWILVGSISLGVFFAGLIPGLYLEDLRDDGGY